MADRALAGIRVVVTRAAHQADRLVALLEAEGARVALLPLLGIVPPADPAALERAAQEEPDWIVITSTNALDALLAARRSPVPERVRLAVVGEASARAARAAGLVPTVVAKRARGEGLLAELRERIAPGERVLLPQAADASDLLAEGLHEAGAEVTHVVAYAKQIPADAAARCRELFDAQPLGWITFTSPSTVHHLATLLGEDWVSRRAELLALSVGPTTSAALRREGIEPAAEAREPGDQGLVAALVLAVLSRR